LVEDRDCVRFDAGLGPTSGDSMKTLVPPRPRQPHPVVVAHQAQRAASAQLRIADAITAFAGWMPFV
jgi:hypothetical protein